MKAQLSLEAIILLAALFAVFALFAPIAAEMLETAEKAAKNGNQREVLFRVGEGVNEICFLGEDAEMQIRVVVNEKQQIFYDGNLVSKKENRVERRKVECEVVGKLQLDLGENHLKIKNVGGKVYLQTI